jgi:hypothetical protein
MALVLLAVGLPECLLWHLGPLRMEWALLSKLLMLAVMGLPDLQ